jgi:translation initiation factor 5A
MDVPNVLRTEYQLVSCIPLILLVTLADGYALQVNIDDGFLNLMTTDGTPKDDVKVPEGDLGTQIQSGFDEGKDLLVTIVAAMGEEQVSFETFVVGSDVHL